MVALKSLVLLALPILVFSNHQIKRTDGPTQHPTCSAGSVKCCEETKHAASDKSATEILAQSGEDVGALNGVPLGINCSPVTVIEGQEQCAQKTFCCTGNTYENKAISVQAVTVGCTPVG